MWFECGFEVAEVCGPFWLGGALADLLVLRLACIGCGHSSWVLFGYGIRGPGVVVSLCLALSHRLKLSMFCCVIVVSVH